MVTIYEELSSMAFNDAKQETSAQCLGSECISQMHKDRNSFTEFHKFYNTTCR